MTLPKLRLEEWEETRLYMQLVCQILGKTRLDLHPPVNHWWHVSLYLAPRGFTTGGMPTSHGILEVTYDILNSRLLLRLADSEREVLVGGRIKDLYSSYLQALHELDVHPHIDDRPYKCKSTIPFSQDEVHDYYDPSSARRAFDVLAQIERPFKLFRGRFRGKCSPVHMFWHSFDLACTRFSGAKAPSMGEVDGVTAEAYSDEVISAGFWFGDDNVPEAALYCYAAPSPHGLSEETLAPDESEWILQGGSPMALLRYEAVRLSDDPEASILSFLESSYTVAADRAGWDRDVLDAPA